MNLINDPWIPAIRADGSRCTIAPWEIGVSENPVKEIVAPRPDFRGAIYQFLIGLIQTAFAPDDDDQWREWWQETPSCDQLKKVFERVADAFQLVNDNGPAFMQDYNLPDDAVEFDIRGLLIDAPGDKTVKDNLDHFVKRDSVPGLCNSCLASSIMTLQTNAPSGGQGHRTGLRGGGPLTTLILPEDTGTSIWKMLWLNVLSWEERFSHRIERPLPEVFPWMGETRESTHDQQTAPEDVDGLQLYWGTPRRIRVKTKGEAGACAVCGFIEPLWTSYRAKNFGVNYSSTWQHALSPYKRKEEKDKSISFISFKGKQGGFTYSDWLSLTIGDEEKEIAAFVVTSFNQIKAFQIHGMSHYRLWCFGYDMDNMKARCWYDQTMPLVVLSSKEKRKTFIDKVEKLLAAADETSIRLKIAVKSAWFSRPKDVKVDTSFIAAAFREETERRFYSIIGNLRSLIEANEPVAGCLKEWAEFLKETARRLFDRFALMDTDEIKNMKRIANAARMLSHSLNSPKSKFLKALKEDL